MTNPTAELFYRLRKSWWRRIVDRQVVVMSETYKVLVHSVSETAITADDVDAAKAICQKLFYDDISSKSEMFEVQIERIEAEPYADVSLIPEW